MSKIFRFPPFACPDGVVFMTVSWFFLKVSRWRPWPTVCHVHFYLFLVTPMPDGLYIVASRGNKTLAHILNPQPTTHTTQLPWSQNPSIGKTTHGYAPLTLLFPFFLRAAASGYTHTLESPKGIFIVFFLNFLALFLSAAGGFGPARCRPGTTQDIGFAPLWQFCAAQP